MLVAFLYDALLVATAVAALIRGGRAERWGAGIMVTASCLTAVLVRDPDVTFSTVDPRLAAIDGSAFVALTTLACRGRAFWPIWAAAMQLLSVAAVFAPLDDRIEELFAYALTEQLWGWLILLLILVKSATGPALRDRAVRWW